MLRRLIGCIICGAVISGGTVRAASPIAWAEFRGPGGQGHAAAAIPAPTDFGPTKNLRWKLDLPRGLSSPCVYGDQIFLTAFLPSTKSLETICIHRTTGEVAWRKAVTPKSLEQVHQVSSPATATVSCDGEQVYVYFGSYGVVAYDLEGAQRWEFPMPVAKVPFGSGASPIVAGDLVIVNRVQQGGGIFGGFLSGIKSELVALNRASGAVVWRTTMPQSRSHATPVYLRREAKDQVLLPSENQLHCFDLATGEKQWSLGGLPRVPTATPIVAGDVVFFNGTSQSGDVDVVSPPPFAELLEKLDENEDGLLGRSEIPDSLAVLTRHRSDQEGDFGFKRWFYRRADTDRDGAIAEAEWTAFFEGMQKQHADSSRQGNAIVSIRLPSDSDSKPAIAWDATKGVPEVPSLLIHQDRLYGIRNGGILACYQASTGELLFRSRVGAPGGYYASPITDGTHIFLASLAGKITVVEPGDKFKRVATLDMGDSISATPAIVDGTLYVRTDQHLFAFANEGKF